MSVLQKIFDERIRKLGISEREAARQINVSPTTISRIRKGEALDIDTLIAVCAWLGVAPSAVLDAYLPEADGLAPKIAAVVEANPALSTVFEEAMDRLLRNEISMEAVEDLIRYAAYRLGLEGNNARGESQS